LTKLSNFNKKFIQLLNLISSPFPKLMKILSGLLFGFFTMVSASAAVTLNFATTTDGIVAGPDGTVAHSNNHGGSLAISCGSGWKSQSAVLNIGANPALLSEYQSALVIGGKITYKLIIVSDEISGSAPGWFEPIYIGNTDGVYDLSFKPAAGQPALYGSGGFPTGATQVFEISYDIEVGPAVSDKIAQFSAASGWNEIFFGLNSGGAGFTGVTFYIDDFTIAAETPPVIPPPTVSLTPSKPGMNLIMNVPGQYDRQGIRTVTPDASWVDRPGPIRYEMNIADFPKTPGAQVLMYFVPADDLQPNMSYPDWARKVCSKLTVTRNNDGTSFAQFAYKDDSAAADPYNGSNGVTGHEYWMPDDGSGLGGVLAQVGSSKAEGLWVVTFLNNTSVTITAPGGETATGTFLPAAAEKYEGAMYVYWTTLAGQMEGLGQNTILSRVATSGVANPIDQDLTQTLGANLEASASNNSGIINVTTADRFWISWSLPASGFVLQQSPSLGVANAWINIDMAPTITPNEFHRLRLLRGAEMVDPLRNYFRLIKP
jgi:hypothetical protein